MIGSCRWKWISTSTSFCAGWKKASLMFLKLRSSFSPRGAWKRRPLECSCNSPAAFLPPTLGRTYTSRRRETLPVRMSCSGSCVTRSFLSAASFSRVCTRFRSSLMSRNVFLRLCPTLALSVTSLMKWSSSPASRGNGCAVVAGGATKLRRRKVQPDSSLRETFLMVEMWKGTRRPKTGSRSVSALPSTTDWFGLVRLAG
mmetsp:Transcript_3937/g.10267  ORF Transcript_3937/g.10267 Transcript_3937/m.10267 type:complete len:200 (-) Transcript_3937:1675-2274(-)